LLHLDDHESEAKNLIDLIEFEQQNDREKITGNEEKLKLTDGVMILIANVFTKRHKFLIMKMH